MVGHEMEVKKGLSFDEEMYLSLSQFDGTDKYNILDENCRGISEALPKGIAYTTPDHRDAEHKKKCLDSEGIREILSEMSYDLLKRSSTENDYNALAREIKGMEHSYKNVMETFLCKMESFLHSIKQLRKDLIRTVQQFNVISSCTAGVTLMTSVMEIAFLAGNSLQAVLCQRLNLLSVVLGSTSITASVAALAYMKQCTNGICMNVKHEDRFFADLIFLHRKGNWIDEEVLRLFPHGIDLDLLEKELESGSTFDDKMTWRMYLCSLIILTNIRKDAKLLKDERFLASVKIFVESQAADIWWHRMKMKKLLHVVRKKIDAVSSKEFIADHAVHYNRTALYLYPVLIPWILTSWSSTGIRFFCSSVAAILAFGTLTNNQTQEFEELKRISQKFEKDLKEITDICNTLDNDYD